MISQREIIVPQTIRRFVSVAMIEPLQIPKIREKVFEDITKVLKIIINCLDYYQLCK